MQTLLCVHVTTVLYGIDQCVQESILTGDKKYHENKKTSCRYRGNITLGKKGSHKPSDLYDRVIAAVR